LRLPRWTVAAEGIWLDGQIADMQFSFVFVFIMTPGAVG